MTAPLIDVLIPVFNGGVYIEESVQSILSQSFGDFTVHVVNDGSTDNTAEILAVLARRDARLRVYEQANGGIVKALNFGLGQCSAKYIARHDADDLAAPDRFVNQVEVLAQRADIVATSGSAEHIDVRGLKLGSVATFASTRNADANFAPAKEPYLMHPFLMVRREAMVRVGGYRYVTHAEDADLYWRLQEIGGLYNDRRMLGQYRIHPESISSRSVANGRVAAVSSQLSALSAQRRRSGKEDLDFSKLAASNLNKASGSLDAACQSVSCGLNATERDHLKIAASGKLLELGGYRPYELEAADCEFIMACYKRLGSGLTVLNRTTFERHLSGMAAKLASQGRWREAQMLLRVQSLFPFLVRLLARRLLPQALHIRARRLAVALLNIVRGTTPGEKLDAI